MRKIKITALLFAAVCLASCGKAEEIVTETSASETVTETEVDYSLLRNWTMNELFAEVKACGKTFSFPIKLEEFESGGAFEDCTFANGTIKFPDGSSLSAESDADKIVKLTAERGSAPSDFTVYDLTLGMSYSEAASGFGIPNDVRGDPANESGTYIYYGAGTQRFEIEFEDKKIVGLVFEQE